VAYPRKRQRNSYPICSYSHTQADGKLSGNCLPKSASAMSTWLGLYSPSMVGLTNVCSITPIAEPDTPLPARSSRSRKSAKGAADPEPDRPRSTHPRLTAATGECPLRRRRPGRLGDERGRRADVTLLQFVSGRAMTKGKPHRPEAVMSGRAFRPAIPRQNRVPPMFTQGTRTGTTAGILDFFPTLIYHSRNKPYPRRIRSSILPPSCITSSPTPLRNCCLSRLMTRPKRCAPEPFRHRQGRGAAAGQRERDRSRGWWTRAPNRGRRR
jgi:hypothetical protein